MKYFRPASKGRLLFAALGVVAAASRAAAGNSCTLHQLAAFPVTMSDMHPLITATINDRDVRFILDSGAFYSMLTPAAAAELKLKTRYAPFGFFVSGIGGGRADASIATVAVLTLAGVPLHNVEFLVGGSAVGADNVGILGQNILHLADVEYDLGQGMVRLIKPQDCRGSLAYWANAAGTGYSTIKIPSTTPQQPHTLATAYVNGKEVRVMFDSGAGLSMLSLAAAARAGITPDSPGVVPAGQSYGVGKRVIPNYVAPVASFKLGDEEIRNTRLRIADLDLPQADMLLGPDFFLSHRIYVSNSQHKLYFSYNGGPVFNLSTNKSAAGADDAAGPATPPDAAAGADDAADFSRRGVAAAARRDFAAALADLTRACELSPAHAEYFEQRALVREQLQQSAEAKADFDQAIALEPEFVAARVARAGWSLRHGDKAGAGRDLDAAHAAASPQADVRLTMAMDYMAADRPDSALGELDLWVAAHEADARLSEALHARCRIRAFTGRDLPLALKDCEAAVKGSAKGTASYADAVASRGLVRLRMADYTRSRADFDASLSIDPRDARSWYGRGIDKMRLHDGAGGQSDIDQASTLRPGVTEEFRRLGIEP